MLDCDEDATKNAGREVGGTLICYIVHNIIIMVIINVIIKKKKTVYTIYKVK